MSIHTARIDWACEGDFARGRYSRAHSMTFDGDVVVPGSASPSVVPLPWSVEAAVDPEEMFVASLSACHMLWFLDLARRAGLVVETYTDKACGVMARDAEGRDWIAAVTLRPRITLTSGDAGKAEAVHHAAHAACFIANSVRTDVKVEPTTTVRAPAP